MRDAVVTDKGLARRLGQEILAGKKGRRGKEKRGTLVFYPDRFAVLTDQNAIPIRKGEVISLMRGSLMANYEPHFVEYIYIGKA